MKEGDKVKWKWGANWAEGIVKKTYDRKVSRKINGKEITRKGSKENKALYIEHDNGNYSLHLESRVEKT